MRLHRGFNLHEHDMSEPKDRQIVAISVAGVENTAGTQCNYVTVVLCNDGSVFEMRNTGQLTWYEYPPIPQPNQNQPCTPSTPT